MHDKIFEIIFDKDEVTWQSIIHDLIKSGQIDPYDVDVSILARKYIDMIKKLQELDFRISGKVLLAAALLLKIKSNRLVGEDIEQFDRLLAPEEELDDGLFDLTSDIAPAEEREDTTGIELIPRTPQPRKRKVSIFDLMKALDKALEVKKRRVLQSIPPPIITPAKTRDITQLIKQVYASVRKKACSGSNNTVMFSSIVPSTERDDKIYTFIPLLHLSNHRRVELFQPQHFGDIEVSLRTEVHSTAKPDKTDAEKDTAEK